MAVAEIDLDLARHHRRLLALVEESKLTDTALEQMQDRMDALAEEAGMTSIVLADHLRERRERRERGES